MHSLMNSLSQKGFEFFEIFLAIQLPFRVVVPTITDKARTCGMRLGSGKLWSASHQEIFSVITQLQYINILSRNKHILDH